MLSDFLFFLLIVGGIVFFVFLIRKLVKPSGLNLDYLLLLVKLPKPTKEKPQEADFKNEIAFFEQFLSNVAQEKKPIIFESAVHHIGEEIHFYLAVPKELFDFIKKQIQGFWSGAQVEPIEDYNIFNPQGKAQGAYLKLFENYCLPIKTYDNFSKDTFEPILGNLAKLEKEGEGAVIQVVVKKAPKSNKDRILKALESLRKGNSLKEALGGLSFSTKEILKALNPPKKEEEKEPLFIDEFNVKLLESKIEKPLFLVNVRLLASASTIERAESIVRSLTGSFEQFAAPQRNNLRIVSPKNQQKLFFNFSFRKFNPSQTIVLNSQEIASFWHFPLSITEVPRLKWLKFRELVPPSNLPEEGLVLGMNIYRGEERMIRLKEDDRRRHLYIVGQTGTGKSTFITEMARQDIKNNKGLAVIDPHGDLIETLLGFIPEERFGDVILFDPSDVERPVGLNMIEYNPERPEEKTFIVNEIQGIFNKLFIAEHMGPMFEQYMRNSLLLLMEDFGHPSTLMEVPRVFTDENWRKQKLSRITNPTIIDFWEKEAVKAGGEASLANMTPYITSKFANFLTNDYVRPIIAQVRSSFNFREVMDEGKILLVNLSKGKIGEINAGLLGMIVVGKILMAALSRVDIPQEQRRDFNLYIDEFQNFTTPSIVTILSEARKYCLNLIIAHQFIAQLKEEIKDAVFGNVGSKVVFRVGAPDSQELIREFEPELTDNDLINIDNFHAYLKLLINGEPSPSFNLRTIKPKESDPEIKEKIKKQSRLTYGRPREEIEKEILQRLRSEE